MKVLRKNLEINSERSIFPHIQNTLIRRDSNHRRYLRRKLSQADATLFE